MTVKTKNILIRICYLIPFLLFLYTIFEELVLIDKELRQTEGMVYVAATIFLFQSIRNSIIGWVLIMLLYLAFLYFVVIGIYSSIQNWGGKIDEHAFKFQCGFAIIYLGLGFLYWRIRPKKRLI